VPGRAAFARGWLTYGLRLAVLAAALGLWQGLSAAGVIRADEFPSMSQTATALWDAASGSSLWSAVGQTLEGWGLGLVIGVAAALLTGTLIGLNGFAYRSVIGVIEFFKAIPVIAILPIGLVLWGATLTMKFALVAFAVFWPLVIQVCYGVRSLDPVARDTTTVLQVRGPRKFLMVILPSAAPFIATGLRVAVAVALIVDIIAELIGGGSGVGERILVAENAGPSAYPVMYAYIVVAGILGVVLAGVFTLAERYALHWHESQRAVRAEGQRRGYPERKGLTLVVQLSSAAATRGCGLSPRASPGRTGSHAGLAVRGPVPGLVVLVGRLEVAVLPAAVVDPEGAVDPVGHRPGPRRTRLVA
jgi:ABC-type nitrate/sulfonate/bicarbonate transport system permease component